jgi:predicted O-methyltransferase YrrM
MTRSKAVIIATVAGFSFAGLSALGALVVVSADDRVGRSFAAAVAACLLFIAVGSVGAVVMLVVDRRRSDHFERRAQSLSEQQRDSVIELKKSVSQIGGSLSKGPLATTAAIDRRLAEMSFQLYRQIEARLILEQRLESKRPLPQMRGYALSPDAALFVVQRILDGDVRRLLETGSGVSTVLCALALQKAGEGGLVVAIEHDHAYAEATRELLAEHGCQDVAEVVVAPLVDCGLEGVSSPWYDLREVDLPSSIDLLLVDGPPASVGLRSRYPALPLLRHLIAPNGRVLLDDAKRPDEQEVLRMWTANYGVDLVAMHRHEKGTAELALVAEWNGSPQEVEQDGPAAT